MYLLKYIFFCYRLESVTANNIGADTSTSVKRSIITSRCDNLGLIGSVSIIQHYWPVKSQVITNVNFKSLYNESNSLEQNRDRQKAECRAELDVTQVDN